MPNSECLAFDSDGSIVIASNSDVSIHSLEVFPGSAFATVKYIMTEVTYLTPIVLSLALTEKGTYLRFQGDIGRTYRLQRASDPAGPWYTFATLTTPPDGAVEHLDAAPLPSPSFYRVAAP